MYLCPERERSSELDCFQLEVERFASSCFFPWTWLGADLILVLLVSRFLCCRSFQLLLSVHGAWIFRTPVRSAIIVRTAFPLVIPGFINRKVTAP